MKATIFLVSILSCSQILYAQIVDFKWAKQMGGTASETGNSVIADTAGNVYTVGNFAGTADFDPGPLVFNLTATGPQDAFISKFDKDGNFLWAKQLSGTQQVSCLSITLNAVNQIYITGNFEGQADFDGGPGVFSLTSVGRQDVFIVKFNADGNFLWAKQFGSPSSSSFGTSITVDVSGNVLCTGVIADTYSFVIKCDASGGVIWDKRTGHATSLCTSTSIVTDSAGNVYTTGYFGTNSVTNPVDFDPGAGIFNLSPDGNADVFVSKLSADGDFVNARQIGGVNLEQAYSITLDFAGNIIITGYFNGKCDFDPGTNVFNLIAQGDEDIFVTKLDNNGKFIWAKQIAGSLSEFGNSISTDPGGNIYLAGYFYGTTDFDPGPAQFNITTRGLSDIYITKLDGDGNFRWVRSMGGFSFDLGHSLFLDGMGNIYTTGYFENLVDFDFGTGVYILSSAGNKDAFVHKMSYCTDVTYANITASACTEYILNGQTYTISGMYTQYLLNVNGCDSILRLNLNITQNLNIIDKSICEGQSYYAAGANQTSSGTYYDTLITAIGCDSVIQTNLTVHPKPKPDLGRDGNLCGDNNSAIISPGSFVNYLWHDNSTQSGFTVTQPGVYWVTVANANNCSATDSLTVTKIDTIPKDFLPAGQQLCYGNVLKITVPGYFTYQWSTGSTDSSIDITNFDTYYLTVKDFNSCMGTDLITIGRKNCIYIAIPNAFTPNGDNKNEIFRPEISQTVKNYSFLIFNRIGQKVFDSREYGKGWDGTLKGKPQPAGSYVYHIKYTSIFGTETVERGSVLLIR